MNKIFKVGFDFDGVIVDHHNTKIDLASAGGFRLEPQQTNSNVIKQFLPLNFYRDMQKKLYCEETLKSPPAFFVGELLDLISHYDIYLISARRSDSQIFARRWLLKNLNKIKEENINFCENEKIKMEKINIIKPDFFIDDKIKILRGIDKNIKKILFDPDYISDQLSIKDSENIKVIHSLKDFLKIVKILKGFF